MGFKARFLVRVQAFSCLLCCFSAGTQSKCYILISYVSSVFRNTDIECIKKRQYYQLKTRKIYLLLVHQKVRVSI